MFFLILFTFLSAEFAKFYSVIVLLLLTEPSENGTYLR